MFWGASNTFPSWRQRQPRKLVRKVLLLLLAVNGNLPRLGLHAVAEALQAWLLQSVAFLYFLTPTCSHEESRRWMLPTVFDFLYEPIQMWRLGTGNHLGVTVHRLPDIVRLGQAAAFGCERRCGELWICVTLWGKLILIGKGIKP